jgi:hypothetical protein
LTTLTIVTADYNAQLIAAWQRCADARAELGKARRERDQLVREAARAGMKPSAVAAAAGIDLARVEEIINGPSEQDVDRFIAAVRAQVGSGSR